MHWRTLSKLVLVTALLVSSSSSVLAALGDHQWSQGFGVPGDADVDGSGNVVSGGGFSGSISFGGATLTAQSPNGDVFLAKHDGDGGHVWSKQFTPTSGYVGVSHLATDATGNIVIVGNITGFLGRGGRLDGEIDFGGGPISAEDETYVAGFDADGNHRFSLTVGRGFPQDVAAEAGYVAVTGYAYASMDFGGGALTYVGGADAFLGVLTIDGAHVWSSFFGDAASQGGMGVEIDGSGNLVWAVTSGSAVDLGGGSLTPTSGIGLALAKFDSSGGHTWSQMFDGSPSSGTSVLSTLDVAISDAGNLIALAGELRSTIDFGGGSLSTNGSGDMYVAQFDGSGNHLWSFHHGGSSTEAARGVAYDSNENLFVAGTFASTNFDVGGSSFTPQSFFADFFVALFDASGVHQWSAAFGFQTQLLISAHTDPQNDLVITGYASAGIDFGGGALAAAQLFHAEYEGAGGGTVVTDAPARRDDTLRPNVPNPFNPSTTIHFDLGRAGTAELAIFDAQGRRVRTLLAGELAAGAHRATWAGQDDAGQAVSSGIYYYRLLHDGVAQTRKMVLSK